MAIISPKLAKATCLVLIAAAVALPTLIDTAAAAKISCGEVTNTLAPCFEYVLGGGKVSTNCCNGVNSLFHKASTTADRRSVCSCLKSVTGTASKAAVVNAKNLPGKCGLSLPYQISPTIDCNRVN